MEMKDPILNDTPFLGTLTWFQLQTDIIYPGDHT